MFVSTLSAGIAASAFADEQCGERPNTAPALQPPLLLTDWPWLARYRDENAKLIASGAKVDTVFLGDSITEGWARADTEFFSKGNVGRGISAQTTPQLLVRMEGDIEKLLFLSADSLCSLRRKFEGRHRIRALFDRFRVAQIASPPRRGG